MKQQLMSWDLQHIASSFWLQWTQLQRSDAHSINASTIGACCIECPLNHTLCSYGSGWPKQQKLAVLLQKYAAVHGALASKTAAARAATAVEESFWLQTCSASVTQHQLTAASFCAMRVEPADQLDEQLAGGEWLLAVAQRYYIDMSLC